jgi:hypothetical protein
LYELKELALEKEPTSKNEIFWMLKGSEVAIKKFIGIRNKVPMPEDQELMTSYAEFIREMTKNTLNAICDATYNKLPSTYKLQYPKWFEEMYGNEEVDATDSSHDNLSENKVIFTLPNDKIEESTEKNTKKKSVTWKEQIYEQKIYEREVQGSDTQESDDKNDLSNKENCLNKTVSSPNNNNISQKSSSSSSANEDLEKSNEKDNNTKTDLVAQNDNLSIETHYNSDSYHTAPANNILSQLQEQTPNIISLELSSKLDALEVENEEKQETEKLMAEIELNLENQQVKVSISEYMNLVNETIWDRNGLDYLNHLNSIYKPESVENIVSLPSDSIIISDLIPLG